MFNPISYGQEVLIVATPATAVTLGFGPNQTPPPRELIFGNTAAITVILPPINTALISPPTTSQAVVGVGNGFQITFRNTTTFVPTITPWSQASVSTDTVADTLTLNASAAVNTLIANADNATWYILGR